MAIVYVGGQVAGFAGKTGTTSVNFALTGGVSSVPAAGDFVIVAYSVGSTADRALTINNASAVAYTLAGAELYQNATFDSNLRVAHRFMPGTPETSFVLSGTGSTADAGAYTVHVFRGVNPTTPLDVAVITAGGINSRLTNPGAITPVTPGAWLYVAGAAACGTGGVYTAPYLTDFRATSQVDTNDAMIGAGYRVWTTGAYDPVTFTAGGTSTNSDSWNAVTLALRPTPDPSQILGTSSPAFSPVAALAGKGSLAGASSPALSTSSALGAVELLRVTWAQFGLPFADPPGPIAAVMTISFGQAASLLGKVLLAGAAPVTFTSVGVARAKAAAVGTTALTFSTAGAANVVQIFGEASQVFSPTGSVRSVGPLGEEQPGAWGESWGNSWGDNPGAPIPLEFTASGTLTAFSPGATLAGTVALTLAPVASMAGDGALVGATSLAFAEAALLRGRGQLAGTTSATFSEVSALRGRGFLFASSAPVFAAVASMAGRGALAGASVPAFSEATLLRGRSASVGQSSLVFTVSGVTTLPPGVVVGTAAQAFSTAGTLLGKGALVGQAASVFSDTAVLRGKAPIAGQAAAVFSSAGAIRGKAPITGTAAVAFSPSSMPIGKGSLAGQSAVAFSTTGAARGRAALAGATTLTLSPAGELAHPGPIFGTTQSAFTSTAALSGDGLMEGSTLLEWATTLRVMLDPRGFITEAESETTLPEEESDEEVTAMTEVDS